jgi:hypothetical protein
VRRLLIVCATVVSIALAFSVLAAAQRSSANVTTPGGSLGADGHGQTQSSAFATANANAPLVLASGVAVRAIALDPRANVYLTNAGAPDQIFALTSLAQLQMSAAASNSSVTPSIALVAGNGVAGSLGDGGGALNSQFDLKLDSMVLRSGIAVAPDGTILVSDTLNATIRRIAGSDSTEPGVVRSVAGRWGPRQETTLSEPLGVALDRAGNLYIADHAGTIYVLPSTTDSSLTQLVVLAHVSSAASIALTADGTKAFVGSPDTGGVFEIDTQTSAIRGVPGFPNHTNSSQDSSSCVHRDPTTPGESGVCPAGLAVDGGGNLFVGDANSGRIFRVDARSSQVTVAAGGLNVPGDMAFDASGNLYVAEQGSNRLLKFADLGQAPGNLTIAPPAALPPPPAPRVCPPTAPFNFCDQPVGGATSTQTFVLTNNTNAAVSGLAISFTGSNPTDFQAPNNNCGSSLNAGASCAIQVDFAPSTTGARAATLSVTDAAGDSATAGLSGTGDNYQITLTGSPMEQSVFQGGTVTFNFNVTPDSVFGGTVTIVCPPSSQLPALTTCTPNPLGVTVTPGTPAPFSVTFATTFDGVLGATTNGALPAGIPGGPAARPKNPISGPWIFLPAFVFFVGAIFWRGFSNCSGTVRRLTAHLGWASAALTLVCAALFLSGCHHSSIPPGLNTPVGATNLTIRGTAQNSGSGNTIILDVVAH